VGLAHGFPSFFEPTEHLIGTILPDGTLGPLLYSLYTYIRASVGLYIYIMYNICVFIVNR